MISNLELTALPQQAQKFDLKNPAATEFIDEFPCPPPLAISWTADSSLNSRQLEVNRTFYFDHNRGKLTLTANSSLQRQIVQFVTEKKNDVEKATLLPIAIPSVKRCTSAKLLLPTQRPFSDWNSGPGPKLQPLVFIVVESYEMPKYYAAVKDSHYHFLICLPSAQDATTPLYGAPRARQAAKLVMEAILDFINAERERQQLSPLDRWAVLDDDLNFKYNPFGKSKEEVSCSAAFALSYLWAGMDALQFVGKQVALVSAVDQLAFIEYRNVKHRKRVFAVSVRAQKCVLLSISKTKHRSYLPQQWMEVSQTDWRKLKPKRDGTIQLGDSNMNATVQQLLFQGEDFNLCRQCHHVDKKKTAGKATECFTMVRLAVFDDRKASVAGTASNKKGAKSKSEQAAQQVECAKWIAKHTYENLQKILFDLPPSTVSATQPASRSPEEPKIPKAKLPVLPKKKVVEVTIEFPDEFPDEKVADEKVADVDIIFPNEGNDEDSKCVSPGAIDSGIPADESKPKTSQPPVIVKVPVATTKILEPKKASVL